MLRKCIQKIIDGNDLNELEASEAMNEIMEGNASSAQIASFITALRMKGETIDEIVGLAKTMKEKAFRISPKVDFSVDTCGTGGDKSNTFNISTASAFVAAAGGVSIAKHGNRSISSLSGSADVLETLGIKIDLSPKEVEKCIESTNFCFMFAPAFHLSMKHASAPRKELGIRTVFNILGPLTNPAGASGQVLGVFDGKIAEKIAHVLSKLGVKHALVVHGSDGLDEITLCGETEVSELIDGKVISYKIKPEDYNMTPCTKNDLIGGTSEENSKIIIDIFNVTKGPKRDIVVLNAAAALYVGKKAKSISEGIAIAEELIDSGKALQKLIEYRDFSNSF
jgi:anthranilate phosphoribosyltransferase